LGSVSIGRLLSPAVLLLKFIGKREVEAYIFVRLAWRCLFALAHFQFLQQLKVYLKLIEKFFVAELGKAASPVLTGFECLQRCIDGG